MYNILVLLSAVEIIQPSSILKNIESIDIYMLGISSILLFFFINDKKISKKQGLILLSVYILYIYSIY